MSLFPIIITQSERIYSGSKQIGRGILMRWTGNAISLEVAIDVSGGSSNQTRADQTKRTIERVWNAHFSGGYNVDCRISMVVGNDSSSSRSHIYIETNPSASHVNSFPALYYATMTLNLPGANLDWTPAHEFGHMLGLDDRYSESVRSQVADLCNGTAITREICGGTRSTTVDPAYRGNIMGISLGILERKNLEDLLEMHAARQVLPGTSRPAQMA